MGKRIFFISSGRLRVFHYESRLREPIDFAADEEGLATFGAYLEQPWKDPVYVLVDLVEEEFREEQIPHVMGADRRALLRTKLNRLFRDPTYCHALFHGRSTEGRRDDRMLFSALTRPDLLAPWMGQMTTHKTPVAGIYSPSLLTKDLLKQLKLEARYLLLVTLQSSGGLRQTFVRDGELKVSRLALLPSTSPERFTAAMLGEVERTRRYLNSLRMLPGDEPLDVYVLATERVASEVERHSPTSITARHHVVLLTDVAHRLGMKGPYDSRFSDRVFAQLLARRTPTNQYAPRAQTRYFRLSNLRRALIAASVFLLMGGLAFGASNFVDGLSAIHDKRSAVRQAAFYQERYERSRARLPVTPTHSRNMKRVVDAVEVLERFRTTPVDMMRVLSSGLDAFPEVRVDSILWRASTTPDAEVGQVMSMPVTRATREPIAPEALRLYQVALVKARIIPFSGNYREALALVRRFADGLRSIPSVEDVQVESLPLDIGPRASLSGDARREAAAADAQFELRVAIRTPGASA